MKTQSKLEKIRHIVYKHAIVSAVILALVFYALMIGVSSFFEIFPASLAVCYIDEITGLLYPIGLVALFGFFFTLKSRKFFRGLRCGMALVVFLIISLSANLITMTDETPTWKPWPQILLGVLSVVAIAIREECFFRAIIQNILAKKYATSIKGIWITAGVSALVFGLLHGFNAFFGVDPLPSLMQALMNVGVGLFFSALYLRSGNLWVLISLHFSVDIVGLFKSVFFYTSEIEIFNAVSWNSAVSGVVFAGIAAFLLRPSKCDEIIQRCRTELNAGNL